MTHNAVIIIYFCSFFISTILFRKAAGSLSLRKLNIISFLYYNLLIFTCVGAACVLLGFRNHYLIIKIRDDKIIDKTALIISYVLVILPLAIIFFNHLFIGRNMRCWIQNYYQESIVQKTDDNTAFSLSVIMAIIGTIATIYVFLCIGGIPVLRFLRGTATDTLRQEVTRSFRGNTYIRNIVMLTITPLLSYLAYIYWRTSKRNRNRWLLLFLYLFVLSLVIKTYNLEKAPVIYYVFYFYIIEVILGNKKLFGLLLRIGTVAIIAVLVMYYGLRGYTGKLFTISSGPGGRIFSTQVATLFLHVKAFPDIHPYLNGSSLPTIIARVVGASESWVRSGRIVMELFNPAGIEAGTAGVMNALFVGEAYANWGLTGVAIAPIVVALPFSFAMAILMRLRKTPVVITLYIALFVLYTGPIHGGFVDYIYNASGIILFIFFLLLGGLVNSGKLVLMGRRKVQRKPGEGTTVWVTE